jgi:hypothetical protein
MLANRNIAVIASGPITLQYHPGAAATPKSQRPHQNRISPR